MNIKTNACLFRMDITLCLTWFMFVKSADSMMRLSCFSPFFVTCGWQALASVVLYGLVMECSIQCIKGSEVWFCYLLALQGLENTIAMRHAVTWRNYMASRIDVHVTRNPRLCFHPCPVYLMLESIHCDVFTSIALIGCSQPWDFPFINLLPLPGFHSTRNILGLCNLVSFNKRSNDSVPATL